MRGEGRDRGYALHMDSEIANASEGYATAGITLFASAMQGRDRKIQESVSVTVSRWRRS